MYGDTNAASAWQGLFLQSVCISSIAPGRAGAANAGDRQGCRKLGQRMEQLPDVRERPPMEVSRDCSYNPSAFPPSMEVRCTKVRLQGRRR